MKLDSRILEGKKPLTCFDVEQAKEFLGKECYFSNCKGHYKNLSAFEKYVSLTDYCIGELTAIMDLGDRVFDVDQNFEEKWEDKMGHFEEIEITCKQIEFGNVKFENDWA